MSIGLRKNVDLQIVPLHAIDHMFASYSPGAHLNNDFYINKIAFAINHFKKD